jgi:hypothetical protein
MEQKTNMQIIAEVKSIEHAKELLDDLKALSNKYDVSINLSIDPAH